MLFRFDDFNSAFDGFAGLEKRRPQLLAMDAVRNDEHVYVYFDAPGFDIDDIDLTIEKNAVTVEASRRWFDADQRTLTSERPQGTFRRQIQFGENLDVDSLSATLDKGVLQLTIPVKEGTKARKVDIHSTSGEKQLTTAS